MIEILIDRICQARWLHRDTGSGHCAECSRNNRRRIPWPCRTHRVLEGVEDLTHSA